MISLSVKNLNVTFQSGNHKVEAVKNACFDVRQGDVYGLVGESGSGKSTLLRSIAGLVPEISGGAIYFEGKLLSRKRSFEFYKNVQMVFQDPYGSLHPRHTVDVTLMEPLKINRLDNKDRRIEQALENVGLDRSYRFRYPHELSGGQRQRVSIARAIIMEPRILLLDEPTSALDVSVQAEILNLLRRLRKEMDLTMILVSHNLAVVSHMCDEMSVMNKGEIVEQMKVEQLRKQDVETDYTKQLLKAAGGYDKDFLETLTL